MIEHDSNSEIETKSELLQMSISNNQQTQQVHGVHKKEHDQKLMDYSEIETKRELLKMWLSIIINI